jgi:hypothetical protein
MWYVVLIALSLQTGEMYPVGSGQPIIRTYRECRAVANAAQVDTEPGYRILRLCRYDA